MFPVGSWKNEDILHTRPKSYWNHMSQCLKKKKSPGDSVTNQHFGGSVLRWKSTFISSPLCLPTKVSWLDAQSSAGELLSSCSAVHAGLAQRILLWTKEKLPALGDLAQSGVMTWPMEFWSRFWIVPPPHAVTQAPCLLTFLKFINAGQGHFVTKAWCLEKLSKVTHADSRGAG